MKKLFSKDFMLKYRMNTALFLSLLFFTLLAAGCSSKSQKQAVVEQDEGINIEDYQEIECRTRVVTGSRFKRKICATKAEWAALANRNRKDVEEWDRAIDNNSNTFGGGDPSDPMGGGTTGAPH